MTAKEVFMNNTNKSAQKPAASHKKFYQKDWFIAYILLIPAFLFLFSIRLWPMVQGIGMSFTNRRLLNDRPLKFVGIDNYIRVFHDKEFWGVAGYTLAYALGTVICSYLLGLGVALLMNMKIRFRGVFRMILMIPWVVPGVVTAYIWKYALNDQIGIINIMLQSMGLIKKPIGFLASPQGARIMAVVVNVWKNYPYMALVMLAGLQSVSEEIKDAARIDGGGALDVFRYVVMPELRTVSMMCTTLVFIWSFNSFDSVFLLTGGGPNKATYVMLIEAYFQAFQKMNLGYATSMATVMLIFMLVVSLFYMRITSAPPD